MRGEGTPGRGRPPGTDSALTELRLFTSATDLFATRGFFGVGIREIATACGFTVASLYHYVGSKEELLERIMTRALLAFTAGAKRALESSNDPTEQLAGLVEMNVLFHATNPRTARVVDKEMDALKPEARARVIAIRDDYERRWSEVIAAGVDAGQFRVPHVNLARLALLGMCAEVAYWYSPSGPLKKTELRDHFVDMALALVGARPERRPPRLLQEPEIDTLAIESVDQPSPTP